MPAVLKERGREGESVTRRKLTQSDLAVEPMRGVLSVARGILEKVPWVLVLSYLAMIAVFTALAPAFLSRAAFANILQDWAPVVLLAAAQTMVIITAGIDLSLGATLVLSGVTAAIAMRELNAAGLPQGLTLLLGVLVALAIGTIVGAVNGLLITGLRLAPFIATLATMGAATGVALVISGGQQVTGGPSLGFQIGNTFYGGLVTLPVLASLAVVVVLGLFLHYARFGRKTYAIGSNTFAARAAGISVDRHLFRLYTLAGTVAAFAGMVVYTRLGGGSPAGDTQLVLNSVAASVVGGVSLFGGVGRMVGTALGALIITSVLSGLIVVNINPSWQQVVIGVIIAIAVALQTTPVKGLRMRRKATPASQATADAGKAGAA